LDHTRHQVQGVLAGKLQVTSCKLQGKRKARSSEVVALWGREKGYSLKLFSAAL